MILSKHRLFKRQDPSRLAKAFLIFCEGQRREFDYFNYFRQLDSRINIVVIPPESDEDNSPEGLYRKATEFLIGSIVNAEPAHHKDHQYDEIWFVIDTDKWKHKIKGLKSGIENQDSWFVAQSNPCFELWLYFHFKYQTPEFEGMKDSHTWKSFVNEVAGGGFDCRKHPILITDAISNSKHGFSETDGYPDFLSTQVFRLAENICEVIEAKLLSTRKKM